MKKVLFIDRDDTIIIEPQPSQQIDSFEKLAFVPGAIVNLHKIAKELEYELVMVTNQDGLGTDSFPEETFWPVHNLMMEILVGEGVEFSEVLIDRSFPADNSPDRKPRTGLLGKYMEGAYDLSNSYVIGDRWTDHQLAENLGTQSILIGDGSVVQSDRKMEPTLIAKTWEEVYDFLRMPPRTSVVTRETKETQIKIALNLDGSGTTDISTGLGFFDHMLDQVGKHSGADLSVHVKGDLHIDEHHTVEDTALALGQAYHEALGDKKGVMRYGFLLPMDDALAQVAIDFGGRPWIVWEAEFKREKVGDMPTEMFYHFFKSFSDTAKCNLNMKVEGQNEHHKIEGLFKAFAKAIKMAVKRNPDGLGSLPSTKGVLE